MMNGWELTLLFVGLWVAVLALAGLFVYLARPLEGDWEEELPGAAELEERLGPKGNVHRL
jgi:hypothetical protein